MEAGHGNTGKIRRLSGKHTSDDYIMNSLLRGCVSGRQLENVRELCQQADGTFDCNFIDGYDELG